MMGYNSTIFAYGQTASGKTFTLTGDHSNPGLIPLSISDIFKFIRSHPNRDFLLRASYLEIYNEQINDLLIPKNQSKPIIKIRQDPKSKHFFPSPIREEVVTTESQVEDLLNRGNLSRHVSGTDFNHRSSRSHTILAIVIESRKVGKFDGIVRRSKVSLIDLAGSERATSDETRRTEGSFINKSLLTLEKVIGALSPDSPNSTHPTKSNSQHIPFRDSKLTQILQPALKGDSKVCVICTLNPTLNHGTGNGLEESRSTLRFARRVKRVRVQAEVNEILSEGALITRYRQQVRLFGFARL
ncbi:kinesin motor domain-containing protein [Melampsora americana]|nr:kinesin motor domain-containing protein [Melampsora americana]